MKRILLALVMICGSAIAVEYGNWQIGPNGSWSVPDISLNAGDRVVFLNGVGRPDVEITYTNSLGVSYGSFTMPLITTFSSSGNYFFNEEARTLWGPSTISFYSANAGLISASYKIIRASESEASANPINIISLPADNNGDVDLLIETSPDLQTWTPIYSDSIGATGTASFIRTRLINN